VLYTKETRLTISLKGVGVRPEVELNPQNGLIDFGSVFEEESLEKKFFVKNKSSFAVHFDIKTEAQGFPNRNGSHVIKQIQG
jgi:hypothetical protein